MSEVNYRRNGNKYSSSGKCWGPVKPKVKDDEGKPAGPKPKSSRERRAAAASAKGCSRLRKRKETNG